MRAMDGKRIARPTGSSWVSVVGAAVVVASLVGLVVGQQVIGSLTDEVGRTLDVSRVAIGSVGETVETARVIADSASAAVSSASAAAESAALASEDAAAALRDLSGFLETSLPSNLDAIRRALPAAISAADGVDTTLGALSLFGVDYAPDEPFADSLRRIEDALIDLPTDLAVQSASIAELVPSADQMAADIGALADDLSQLSMELSGSDDLADSYGDSVSAADIALSETESSVEQTRTQLRIVLAIATISGVALGLAIVSIDRKLDLVLRDPGLQKSPA